jgi:hypothetical protein
MLTTIKSQPSNKTVGLINWQEIPSADVMGHFSGKIISQWLVRSEDNRCVKAKLSAGFSVLI